MKAPIRFPAWAAVLPLLAAYAALKHAFGILICDDAYITLAHARSWASGLGPIMSSLNPVCATSTPLHTALLALAGRVLGGGDYPEYAYWINALWDLAGCFYLYRLARFGRKLPGPWPWLCVAAYALSVNALAVSASGMETPMYVALALAGTWYAFHAERAGYALALVAFLAPLARPEGALLPGVLILMRGFGFAAAGSAPHPPAPSAPGAGPGFRLDRDSRLAAAAAVLGLGLFFAFNLYAYGHALPHSIVAKRAEIHIGLAEGLRAWVLNVFFKGPCFGGTRTVALANLAVLAAAASGWIRRRNRNGTVTGRLSEAGGPRNPGGTRAAWILLVWPGAYFLFFLATGASYVLFAWYFLPVLPFLILVVIEGLARRLEGLPPSAAWALFFGFLAFVPAQTFRQGLPAKHRLAEAGREGRYREAARIVDSLAVPGHPPTIMIDEVGAIGYGSHARILDMHGLLSPEAMPYLGPAEGHWPRMAKLQDRMDPEWIVALRLVKDEGLLYPGEDGFYAGYAPFRILRRPGHPYNLEIWRRLPPD